MAAVLHGHVAWVTGGGSGIGRALAHELAARGASLVLSGRRQDRLQTVVEELESKGHRAWALPLDVTDEQATRDAVETILEREGNRLDVVVANAGFGVAAPFEQGDAAAWRHQLDVNVVGTAITLAAALPALKRSKGRLAVVGSVLGKMAVAGSSAYCASKFALVGMCDALFQELHGTGVSLTHILPGLVESEFAQVDNLGVHHPDAKDARAAWLVVPAEVAAMPMVDALVRRQREVVVTAHGKVGAAVGQHLPGLLYPLMARLGVRGRG